MAAFSYPAQIWMGLAAISRLPNVGHKYVLIRKDIAVKRLHIFIIIRTKGMYEQPPT